MRAHLQTLRGRLFSHIITALDTSSPAPAPGCVPLAGGKASSWQRVRERFLSIFTSPRAHPVPGVHADLVRGARLLLWPNVLLWPTVLLGGVLGRGGRGG